MSWEQKLNSFWKGLLIGFFFPIILYVGYWLFFYHQISFPVRFTKYLLNGNMLSGVVKICGIANLLLFYFGLTKKIDAFTKGIIVATIVYVALVAYLMYFHETVYL
ncbi:MAG: hypothetical protein JSU07_12355 [Bacteroidetes bacterium]|nr:hypothetical protein [Bacteroidota bacterium]